MLWKPAFFGVKPELVIKGGFIAGAMMGDGNASIPTPQPVIARMMFGGFGAALVAAACTSSARPVSTAGRSMVWRGGAWRSAPAAASASAISCLNDALPKIEVDPDTYEVRADGERLTCEPAAVLPMAQRYFLF